MIVETFHLHSPVEERPLTAWNTVAEELAGTQTRIVQGARWRHRVIEAGSGPPLLMYHGIGGHAETYARNLRALSAHFHVYAVDALFHGRSSKDGFDLPRMYDLLADGFIDLVDALGHSSVNFEGESMGAMFGVDVAMRYPERIDKMVLTSGFYLLKTPDATFTPARGATKNLGELSEAAVTKPTFENIKRRMQWLVSQPERMTDDIVTIRQELYQDPEVSESMRRVFNLGSGPFSHGLYDWEYTVQDLRGWKPKTLVLWGQHNPGRGPEFGEYCAEQVGAQFYVFDDSGHWPQWEQPDEYNQVLIQFLTE